MRTKSGGKNRIRRTRKACEIRKKIYAAGLLALFLFFSINTAYPLPEGYQAEDNSATFDTSTPNTLIINAQENAVINYNSFDIAQNEAVYFYQPSSSSNVLNNVIGERQSNIAGYLYANGNVFIVNPNGIVFDPRANINVGSLVASTMNIDTTDFRNGNFVFQKLNKNGQIVNQAVIRVNDGGFIALLAQTVKNEGMLEANQGTVVLASGNKTTLTFDSKKLIQVVVDEPVTTNPTEAQAAIINTGTISANGGKVIITANAARSAFANAVNNEGMITAGKAVTNADGTIALLAPEGDIKNSGTMYASGDIEIKADKGGITQLANADVTSDANIKYTALADIQLDGKVYGYNNIDIKSEGGKVIQLASADVAGRDITYKASGDIKLEGKITAADERIVYAHSGGHIITLADITAKDGIIKFESYKGIEMGGRYDAGEDGHVYFTPIEGDTTIYEITVLSDTTWSDPGNITVAGDVTGLNGASLSFIADNDDSKETYNGGDFTQLAGTTISTQGGGDITIRSGQSASSGTGNVTVADVRSSGSLDISAYGGEIKQIEGTKLAVLDGDLMVDSPKLTLYDLEAREGHILVGSRIPPVEIAGLPHYIHTAGNIEINTVTSDAGITTLGTTHGDILRYATAGKISLEATNGKVTNISDIAVPGDIVKLIGNQIGSIEEPFIVNAETTHIYRNIGDIDIVAVIDLEGDQVTIVGPVEGFGAVTYCSLKSLTLEAQNGGVTDQGQAIIPATTLTLIGNNIGHYAQPFISAAETTRVVRTNEDIVIALSSIVGESVTVRGPPEDDFAITYLKNSDLSLESQAGGIFLSQNSYLEANNLTLRACEDSSFGYLIVKNTLTLSASREGANPVYSLTGDIVVSNLTINHCVLDGGNAAITLSGSWAVTEGGSFRASGSTIILNDASKVSYIYGNNTFYNFTCITPGKTIIFIANTLTTIQNTLTIEGAEGNYVTLESSIAAKGSEFGIYINDIRNAKGDPYAQYINVYYSHAYGPLVPIPARNEIIPKHLNIDWDATIYADVNSGLDMDWNDPYTWIGGYVPTQDDDVIIDSSCLANSIFIGTLNYGDEAWSRSLNSTGFAGTITGDGQKVLNVNGGAVILSSWTNTAGIVFWGGSPTLTSNGQNVGFIGITMNATLTLQDALTCNSIDLLYGTLDTNGKTVNVGSFTSNGANGPMLALGASIFNVSGDWTTDDTLYLMAGTSSIRFTGTNVSVNFYSQTPYEVRFNGAGTATIASTTSFTNLQRNGTATKTCELILSGVEVTGTLTLSGNSATNRILVRSSTFGTGATFTIGMLTTVTASNVDFQDITFSDARDLSGISGGSGDCGGNSGITFTTATTQTWKVDASGSWSTASNWTSRVPLPQDDVSFNYAFSAGRTITMDMPRMGKNISFSGATNTPGWTISTSNQILYGSLNLTGVGTITQAQTLYFQGRGSCQLTSNSKTFPGTVRMEMIGGSGTLTLQDNFNTSGGLTLIYGTLNVGSGRTITVAGTLVINSASLITGTSNNVTITANTIAPSYLSTTTSGNITINSTGTVGAFTLNTITSAGDVTVGGTTPPSAVTINGVISRASSGGTCAISSNANITQTSANIGSATYSWNTVNLYVNADNGSASNSYTGTGRTIYASTTVDIYAAANTTFTVNGLTVIGNATVNIGATTKSASVTLGTNAILSQTAGRTLNVYSNGNITQNVNIGSVTYAWGNVYFYVNADNTTATNAFTYTSGTIYAATTVDIYAAANTTLTVGGMTVVGNAVVNVGDTTKSASVTLQTTAMLSQTAGRTLNVYSNGDITQNVNIGSVTYAWGNVYFYVNADNTTATNAFTYTSGTIYAATTVDIYAAANTTFTVNGLTVIGNAAVNVGATTKSASVTLQTTAMLSQTAGRTLNVYSNGDITQNVNIGSATYAWGNVYFYVNADNTTATNAFTYTSGTTYASTAAYIEPTANTTLNVTGANINTGKLYIGNANPPASITISGNVTAGSNNMTIKSAGGLTISAGTVNASSASSIFDIDGSFSLSGGTFSAPSVSNDTSFTVAGGWSITSTGIFTPGIGRVVMDTGGSGNIITTSSGADDFYDLKITGGSRTVKDPLTVTHDLTITAGEMVADLGVLMDITVGNDMTVSAACGLNANAKGNDTTGQPLYAGGAGFGGEGGAAYPDYTHGSSYGSIATPYSSIGSKGGDSSYNLGGYGGGGIKLTITGTLSLGGYINANGANGTTYNDQGEHFCNGGGGSGGSIYISANTITGAGTLSAIGGNGGNGYDGAGGGGGGRIAIYYTTSSSVTSGSVYGGTYTSGGDYGKSGTFYSKKASDPAGSLTVNNNGQMSVYPISQTIIGDESFMNVTFIGNDRLNVGSISIYGNLNNGNSQGLDASMSSWHFLATDTDNTVTSSNGNIGEYLFEGSGGKWTLQDTSRPNNIRISEGATLYCNGQTINGTQLYLSGTIQLTGAETLDLQKDPSHGTVEYLDNLGLSYGSNYPNLKFNFPGESLNITTSLQVGGSLTAVGTTSITATAGEITLDPSVVGSDFLVTFDPTYCHFYDLQLGDYGGTTWTLATAIDVDHNMDVVHGTLDTVGYSITVDGILAVADQLKASTGNLTVTANTVNQTTGWIQAAAGNVTFNSKGTVGSFTFNYLTASGDITIGNTAKPASISITSPFAAGSSVMHINSADGLTIVLAGYNVNASDSSSTFDIDGNVSLSGGGGAFLAPNVNNDTAFTVGGSWSITGTAVFTPGTCRVVFDGSGTKTITTTSSETDDFYDMKLDSTTLLVSLSSAVTVTNTLDIINGTLDKNSQILTTGTFNYSKYLNVGGVAQVYYTNYLILNRSATFVAPAAQSGIGATITLGTLDLAGYTMIFTGTLTVNGGNISSTSNNIAITANTVNHTSGSITTATSGNITINSTGTVGAFTLFTITSAGDVTIGTSTPSTVPLSVTINGIISRTTAGGTCSIYSNSNITQAANIGATGTKWANVYLYVDYDKSGTATYDFDSGTIYASTAVYLEPNTSSSTALTLEGMTVDTGSLNIGTTTKFSSIAISGSVSAGSNVIDLKTSGGLTISAGTTNASSANSDWDVDGNFILSGGTFSAPGVADDTSFMVGGGWSITGTAIFTPNGGRVYFDTNGGTITTSSSGADDFYDVKFNTAGKTWTLADPLTATHDFYLSAGTITHAAEDTDGVDITAGGAMTILSGTYINVDYKGYGYDSGTGAGGAGMYEGGGAAYGSDGGQSYAQSAGIQYGYIDQPTNLGSGGGTGNDGSGYAYGGSGGGYIRLNVTGALINSGYITANGNSGESHTERAGGGGSGGAIYITCGSITNSGTIQANGGAGGAGGYQAGGGAGGRIAIHYTSGSAPSGTIQAYGGGGYTAGGPGTVYIRDTDYSYGSLTINNNNQGPPAVGYTHLLNTVFAANYIGDLTITNGPYVVFEGATTIYGSFYNNSTFDATTSMPTISFAATDMDNTITSGGCGFYNVCFTGANGKWTLQDQFNCTGGTTTVENGVLDINGQFSLVVFAYNGGYGTDPSSHNIYVGDTATLDQTGTYTAGGAFDFTTLTINNGVIFNIGSHNFVGTIANSGTVKLVGDNADVSAITTGTVEYTGQGSTYTGLKAGYSYQNLTFSGTGTYDLYDQGTLAVSGALTLNGPSLTATIMDTLHIHANSIDQISGTIYITPHGMGMEELYINSTGTPGEFKLGNITGGDDFYDDALVYIGTETAPSSITCYSGTTISFYGGLGQIQIRATGDITLANVNAGTVVEGYYGSITVTSTTGHIYGNNSNTLTAYTITLSAASGKDIGSAIGSKNLKVNASTLTAISGNHPNICITNAGSGNLTIGNMTNAGSTAVDFNKALTIGSITVTEGSLTIGSTYNPSSMIVSNNISTTLGGITIVTSGTLTQSGGTISTTTSGTIALTSVGSSTLRAVSSAGALTLSSTSAATYSVTAYTLTVPGVLTINSGVTLSLGGGSSTAIVNTGGSCDNKGTLQLKGDETLTGFTNDTGEGLVKYVGTSTYTGLKAGYGYYDLTFDGVAGEWDVQSNLTVNHNLTITNGTLDMAGYGFSVGSTATIDPGGSSSGTLSSSQRKTFFDTQNSTYWAFYYNGSAIEYSYSTNGSSWQRPAGNPTLDYNTTYFSVAYKTISSTSYAFVMTDVAGGGSGYDVAIQRGTCGASAITFASAITVFDGASSADYYSKPTIALDSNNYIWVGARRYQEGYYYQANVRRSTNVATGDLSSWGTESPYLTNLGGHSSTLTSLVLVPGTGSNMSLLVVGASNNITHFVFNGSSWSSADTGGDYSWFVFPYDDLNGAVHAMTVIGTVIYVGGDFTLAGGLTVNRIAKYTPSTQQWEALGSTPGVNNSVRAFAVDTSNNLYVGGLFTVAGGSDANRVAKWSGSWSVLGTGANSDVYALSYDTTNSILYAGGNFTTAGGNAANYIAQWNGTTWSALGTGMNQRVRSLAVDSSNNLYAGGDFTTAGGNAANYIAKWTPGTPGTWAALGSNGTNGPVYAMAVVGSNIYAGGNFTTAGGNSANYTAKWSGSSWSALGSGMNNMVYALKAIDASNIYAGGDFTTADGNTVNYIAKWSGSSWSALNTGTVGANARVRAITLFGSDIYAGGEFTTTGGSITNYIAKYVPSTSTWTGLSSSGTIGANNYVYALAVLGTDIYVGGSFLTAGGITVNRIAKYTPSTETWSALGTGVNNTVRALAVIDGKLYVGGYFTTAGAETVNRIAKWTPGTPNGTWAALNTGTPGVGSYVMALTVLNSELYVGGYFTTAGGTSGYNRVAKYTPSTSTWSTLGTGMNATGTYYVNTLAVFDDDPVALYAGGNFTTASGNTVNNIAKWNGSSWSALNTGENVGTNGIVNAIATLGADIYVGGFFLKAGGIDVNRIAKYTPSNQNWAALSMGGNIGVNSTVRALAVIGSDLYVGGDFLTAGGVTVNRIAKWTGTTWAALNTGSSVGMSTGSVYALVANGSDLYAGGTFIRVKGLSSGYYARYGWAAAADVNPNNPISPVSDIVGNIHMLYLHPTTSHLLYGRFNIDTMTWGAVTTVYSGASSSPAMSIDSADNSLHAFWISSNTIYGKSGAILTSNTEWDATATSLYSTGTNTNVLSMYEATSLKTPLLWTKQTGETYDVLTELSTASKLTLDVKGNWSNAGTFNAGASTVTLSGTGSQTVTTGGSGSAFTILTVTNTSTAGVTFSNALYAGTLNASSGVKKLSFGTTGTHTITDSFNINGSAGNLITLAPATPTTTWYLNAPVGSSVSYVDVTYSSATSTITATHSTGSNNTNWNISQ